MTMAKKTYFALFIILILSVYSLGTIRGTVRGVVTDKAGNPIEGVTITISNVNYTSINYVIKTNDKGEYFQMGLQPDYYSIKAEKDGYLPNLVEKRIPMQVTTVVDIELEEGQYFAGGKSPGEDDYQEALAKFEAGDYEACAQALLRAIEKEPFEPVYTNNLGVVYTKMEKYDEAIEAFKKMLEIQPESYTANKKIGELYGFMQDYENAAPFYKKAVELSPNDPDAFYNLGACATNLHDFTGAMDAFSSAVELKPDFAAAYYQLGMVYVNQNKKEDAVTSLEKFLELAPDDPNAAVAKQLVEYLKK
jgi:tetratricopeptide (TPR) repeat protein